jgi:hypothetical protein
MNSQSPKHDAIAVAGLAFLLALSIVPTARGQNYGPWSPPINLNNVVLSDGTVCPAAVNSASNDSHPAISKDGLSLFFVSNRPGGFGDFDIWVTTRNSLDDCWLPPVNLGPTVNSSSEDFAPNLSTDGHWLFFNSKRGGGCNGGAVRELWATHRHDSGDNLSWEAPNNLGCAVNLANADNAGPDLFEDESGNLFLYFTRSLVPNNPAFADIYVSACTSDLATCNTQGLWETGTKVDTLSSPYRDTRMAVRRRDGLEIILSSGRPGSLGSENLWVSTRAVTSDQLSWATPEPINCDSHLGCSVWNPEGLLVNSPAFDGGPALSWDGTELYFFSERMDLPGFAGGRDLYVAKRTKLTRPN